MSRVQLSQVTPAFDRTQESELGLAAVMPQVFSGPSSRSDRRLNVGEVGGLFLHLMAGLCLSAVALSSPAQASQGLAAAYSMAAMPMASQVQDQAQEPTEATLATVSLDDISAGQLLFKTDTGGEYIESLLLESRAHFSINGMLARVSISQQFENTSDEWMEGVYAFPLPEDAAVDYMRIRIGERIIEGKIREREEAKKIYQAAKASGRTASLVEQERPNLFTNSVANIAPGETVEISIEYLQTVRYDQGRFELRMPMTLTPRYIPGNELAAQALDDTGTQSLHVEQGMGWASATDEVPDAQRITPYMRSNTASTMDADGQAELVNPIRITGELNMGMPLQGVDSQYHNIILERSDDLYEFHLLNDWVAMDHDFVLRWEPVVGQEPQAAVFSESIDGEDYAMLMIMPPQLKGANGQVLNLALPKEMIFVVDTSGSMSGVSIKQAKFSLLYALEQLQPGDRFNVIEFNSDTHTLFPQPVLADAQNLQQAMDYVDNLKADGGTNMYPALQSALWQNTDEAYLRQVIFITDGAVGNEEALFGLIHNDLGSGRLFTVGIGSAPNSYFMRKAAEFGRGSFTYIANVGETHVRMRELFTKLQSPLSFDIEVQWPHGAVVEAYPERIPDLYAGEPVLVAAKLDVLNGAIQVTGKTADQAWQRDLMIQEVGEHDGVATLWGRRKIDQLLDAKAAGADAQMVREQVLETALTHQILSPYTSFIAVEEAIRRPEKAALNEEAVANAMPKGQTMATPARFAYPQTATSSLWSLLFGFALVALSLLRWQRARRGFAYVASL